jgi:hypothetical protein
LNQLSRLLFDTAATKWYWATILEVVGGIISVILSFTDSITDIWKLWGAALVMSLLVAGYILRQIFESQYEMAETMRRQSVLTEGLGFPIKSWMFSEWRRRSGRRLLKRFTLVQRNDDYYVTKKPPGSRRLLEMTQESAFWTRFLYSRLLDFAVLLCLFAILLLAAVLIAILTGSIPDSIMPTLAYGIFLAVPILLTSNVVGWVLKLRRLISGICSIEKDLEELASASDVDQESVLRLVFEYNCQVAAGFPIPSFIFKMEHNRIAQEWEHAHKGRKPRK